MAILICCSGCADTTTPQDVEQQRTDTITESNDKCQISDQVDAGLSNRQSPYNIVIIGDNTSKMIGGWVNIFANWVSTNHQRPVRIYEPASATSESAYREVQSVSLQIDSEAVNIFNANPENLTVHETALRIPTLLPTADMADHIDLILYSQGQNAGSRSLAKAALPSLKQLRNENPETHIVAILQNPWRPDADVSKTNELNISDLRTSLQINDFAAIDINQRFIEQPNWESLLDPTGTYPNADGYILWAAEVEKFASGDS
ncbi:hypothetical protein DK926_04860 [Rhodococcus sp. Eu-32]|uniref:hypothetical protein n=1 Tax=Rhodococcus sp. Eu-32 TaxID=1017319 RepID=UPI000F772A51|nr:hypothetical protein [Rhodococcus sp. Eu-32]RRQ29215.1 hypothetical protein DK926_04860 [Rhodococcus sp. Eu-32]